MNERSRPSADEGDAEVPDMYEDDVDVHECRSPYGSPPRGTRQLRSRARIDRERPPRRRAALSSAVWALALPVLVSAGACTRVVPDISEPITIEDILAIRDTGEPMWSPDGSQVAFPWGVGTERSLWAAEVAAPEPGRPGADTIRQLAPLSDRASFALSPDWQYMAYVSKRQVWKVPLDGGLPERLTTDEGKYSGLNWSPDGSAIAFVLQNEDPDQTDVGVVAATGGSLTMIATSSADEDSTVWSPSSGRLAYQRRTDDWHGYEIRLNDLAGNDRVLAVESYERGVEEFRFDGNHHWSPDGSRIVYLSSRSGYNHLWVVPVEGDEPVEITTGMYVDYSPRWSPAGDRIVFVGSRSGDLEERHVWVVGADGGEPVRISPDGFSRSPSWSPDGSRVAYLRSSPSEPPEVVVQDATPGAIVRRLTESRPDPALTASFVEPEAVRYPSEDGTEVPAILLRPRARDAEVSRPGLLWFHGKGGINLKGWGGLPHYAFHQRLVQQGYSVLFINWRGTHIGYGAAWERANYRDYAGGELDDVVAGAEFLSREVGVDPARIACWGGSYGGYMTMLVMTRAPGVCSAGISMYGVSDWDTFLDQSARKLWNVRLLAKLGDPDDNPELYERSAAIDFVEQATGPLLILQGQDDDGVVPEQGISLFRAMHQAGKPVDYVAYIGEGHGFRHTGSVRDLYRRVEDFLQRHNREPATRP